MNHFVRWAILAFIKVIKRNACENKQESSQSKNLRIFFNSPHQNHHHSQNVLNKKNLKKILNSSLFKKFTISKPDHDPRPLPKQLENIVNQKN